MRIVVIGGSGLVGAKLVNNLRHRGHDVLAASPQSGVNTTEIVQRLMRAIQDSREVVTDPHARYFGAALSDDTLTPDEGAIIGVTRFDDWLRHSLN